MKKILFTVSLKGYQQLQGTFKVDSFLTCKAMDESVLWINLQLGNFEHEGELVCVHEEMTVVWLALQKYKYKFISTKRAVQVETLYGKKSLPICYVKG